MFSLINTFDMLKHAFSKNNSYLCKVTKNRALFFSENWNFKIDAVSKEINNSKLFYSSSFNSV